VKWHWVIMAVAVLVGVLTVGVLLLPVHTPEPSATVDSAWFREVTAELGLDFVQDPGPVGDYFMPQIMGSGVAVLDADGDGRLDLYLLHGGGPTGQRNQLYLQQADGRFQEASRGSGLNVAGFSTGVAIGDVNNDGRDDVLLVQYGGIHLFLNAGGGQFLPQTTDSGLSNPEWGTSASFVDFDRDGWLDLIVVNYVAFDAATPCFGPRGQRDYCHPSQFPGQPARLFRNRGKQADGRVRFEDVSRASGVGSKAAPGLGVLCADFDGDGWPDLFVANDGRPNHLWINQRDGSFREQALQRGLALDGLGRMPANMGIALGDVNGDGLFDLLVTHLTEETHTLWQQGPRGLFRDRTSLVGLAEPSFRGTGFGTALADFDYDGHLDAVVVNGRVALPAAPSATGSDNRFAPYAERNQLFGNDGQGRFLDRSVLEGHLCGRPGVHRGLAIADLSNRGLLDVIVTEVGGPARIFRCQPTGNWLVVRAVDPQHQRDAIGAELTLEAGSRRWWRLIQPGASYLSSNDPRAHFGLGETTRLDRLRIRWPDGSEEWFVPPSVNTHWTVRKGEGQRP
jgi:hypothetical protein